MNRREMMRLLGGALALPLVSGVTAEQLEALGRAAHRRARARVAGLAVLDPHQAETVATIAEMIIPETDTPGARAARVPEFIDLMLAEWFADGDRARFLAGLADVDARSRDLFGADFISASEPQRGAILSGLDAEVAALRRAKAKPDKHFFHQIKSLTLYGFYTSEIGAAETHFEIIPGSYDGCVPLP
jgi:glucoside 3-dehydrogenase (cytochrome c) hitch-hiker subunit